MKKVITIILAFLMVCSTCVLGGAERKIEEKQIVRNQIEANEQYQKLLARLESEAIEGRSGGLGGYYGGAYVNEDGNMVVCVSDDYSLESNIVETYTDNDEIVVRRVGNTFAELKEEQALIDALQQQYIQEFGNNTNLQTAKDARLYELVYSICGTYISERRNVLVVEMEELTSEKIKTFRDYFSDKVFVVFEEGEFIRISDTAATATDSATATTTATTAAIAVKPGTKIYSSNGMYGSMGFPVYYTAPWGQRTLGFISAGHVFEEGDIVYYDAACTTAFGVCQKSQYSGSVDAALIRMINSNFEPSFVTRYGNTTLNGSAPILEGSFLFLEGCVTADDSYGEVLSTNHTARLVNLDNTVVTITDTYKTSAQAAAGDSGGVAYDVIGRVVGVISGGTASYSIVCKYANIAGAFSCSVS